MIASRSAALAVLLCFTMSVPVAADTHAVLEHMVACISADENHATLAAVTTCAETGKMADTMFRAAQDLKSKQDAALHAATAYVTAGDSATDAAAQSFSRSHDLSMSRGFLIDAKTYLTAAIRAESWLGQYAATASQRKKFQHGATSDKRKVALLTKTVQKIP